MDVLWAIQVVGGALSIIVALGVVVGMIHTRVGQTPSAIQRFIGLGDIEEKVDSVLEHQRWQSEITIQQAEEFNSLASIVCEEHDIPDERKPHLSTNKIRTYLLDGSFNDFTRDNGHGET